MYKLFTMAAAVAVMPLTQKVTLTEFDCNNLARESVNILRFKNTLNTNFWEAEKKPAEAWSQNWMGQAQENIRKSEYHFKWEEKYKAYCTPNRKNNLRFFYNDKGFTAEPRTTKMALEKYDPFKRLDERKYKNLPDPIAIGWKVKFILDKKQVSNGKWEIVNSSAEYITDKITVQYINNDEGMRQNFIVHAPLSKSNTLKINFSIKTKLKTYLHGNQLQFFHKKKNVLNYEQLKVWDANGKPLEASIKKNKRKSFYIQVDAKDAVYPITVDPLSATPDKILDDCNQANANFGISVASAGDVNGDGYSDVIIGAYSFDDGANTDEGRAFVYHGSASGLPATASNTPDDPDQPGANFGYDVASAGDVNGDGYSDVIIGAYHYDDGGNTDEGRAFVYHGSAAGLSATPDNTPDDADQASAFFGCSVASAGDVNGDGYSDVIIGANGYNDSGNSFEGRAFVYHGSAAGLSATPDNTPDDANQAGAQFGISVASAGDVNGDGYSDVIIGAWFYNDSGNLFEGRAFVYHGSAAGLSGTPDNTPDDANQQQAYFGCSVASAGDVNGDGYSDVIIGAYGYAEGINSQVGHAFVYHGSATGLSAAPDIVLDDTDQATALFGGSVASAGDINGDGYSDVIIGAHGFNDGPNIDEGNAFVHLGSATGLSATPASILDDADQAFAQFGISVASAGDVNGDGYSDVIIGANGYDDGLNTDEGRAFVYNGSAAGINATSAAMVESNQVDARLGYSVAGAGDVNADGFDDVIVGALLYSNGQSNEGAVFVYHGSATGISTTADLVIESNYANAFLGGSVACAGDVNGDGYSDIIVGAEQYSNGQAGEGAFFVYHGSAAGINSTPAAIVESNQVGGYLGISVACAGDVNGDGYSDVIAGAWRYDNVQVDEGAAFIFHGSASGINTTAAAMLESNQAGAFFGRSVAGAGDVNGDGYSDVIVGSYLFDNGSADEGAAFIYHGSASGISTTATALLEKDQASAGFGISVSSAGDVNGDGYSDVIVGSWFFDNGSTDEGAAFVYHGSGAGINTTVAAMLESNQASAFFGNYVSCAGDVNGDGYSDVIVGSMLFDNGQADEGAAFVYQGSPAGINTTAAAMLECDQAGANMGYSAAGAGDINADGYSDVVSGAWLFDNGEFYEGAAFVYMGNSPGTNKRNNLRMYNSDMTTPINSTNFIIGNFGAGLFAKSFLGKTKGKLVWETRLNYNAYSGTPITNSTFFTAQQTTYTDLGLAGTELKNLIDKLLGSGRYTKVRARVKYDPVTAITGQVYGPWRNVSAVIDGNSLGALPIELISFNAAWLQKGKTARLDFTTDKESGICCFEIEKSNDGFSFSSIGIIAARNTAGIQQYSFIDNNATNKKQFYRLKIKGFNGKTELSNIQQLQNNGATEILVFPNPTAGELKLQLNGSYNKINVQVVNSIGQVLKKISGLPVSGQTISIPVHDLPAGRYWLLLQGGNEKQALQFVKE